MKNISVFAGLLLIGTLASCNTEVDDTPVVKTPKGLYAVSPQEASAAVQHLLAETPTKNTRGVQQQSDTRQVEEVIDLAQWKDTRGVSNLSTSVADNFYVVNLKNNQGYAFVSKDKRTFPVFSILDHGHFDASALEDDQLQWRMQQMLSGFQEEVDYFDKKWSEEKKSREVRANESTPDTVKTTLQDLLNDGWQKFQDAPPKMKTTWRQEIMFANVFSKDGFSFSMPRGLGGTRTTDYSEAAYFGCTPVAYGQVMYALREYPGFNSLRYSNGQQVLWDKMDIYDSREFENQRFLGWFAANCSPKFINGGTMVFNTVAKDFMRRIVGPYIESRYDNCIVTEGDFDGFGWSESARISHEYFAHPQTCYVIMTAAASGHGTFVGQFNLHYHTFVIDGMTEFHKRQRYGALFWKRWKTTVRHMYHVNAGWGGACNGYYLYVDSRDSFNYNGKHHKMDYRSKASYFVVRPKQDKP